MKKIVCYNLMLFWMNCMNYLPAPAQTFDLTGRWKVIDLRTTDHPEGLVAELSNEGLKKLKARYDSSGEKMEAADSAAVRKIAESSFETVAANMFIQLNPDGTASMRFEDDLLKAKYEVMPDEKCLIMEFNKGQRVNGDLIKLKANRKLKFFYTLVSEELKLDNEDGDLGLLLRKK